MPVLLELPAIAGVYVLIAILFVVAYTFTLLAHVLNFSILGIHPLANVAHAIENTIINGCNDGIQALEHYAVRFEGFMVDSVEWLIKLLMAPLPYVNKALSYLWHQIVKPWTNATVGTVRTDAVKALALATAATGDIARLSNSIAARISHATSAVYNTVTAEYHAALRHAETDINLGIDKVARDLRAEFEAGLKGIDVVTKPVTDAIAQAETDAIAGIQAAEDATIGEIQGLLRSLNPAEIAGLIAAVPLLSTLVQTLLNETGLSNSECRAKVKNICATDPSAWGNLLAGLAPLALVFSLRDAVEFARPLLHDLAATIREVA